MQFSSLKQTKINSKTDCTFSCKTLYAFPPSDLATDTLLSGILTKITNDIDVKTGCQTLRVNGRKVIDCSYMLLVGATYTLYIFQVQAFQAVPISLGQLFFLFLSVLNSK